MVWKLVKNVDENRSNHIGSSESGCIWTGLVLPLRYKNTLIYDLKLIPQQTKLITKLLNWANNSSNSEVHKRDAWWQGLCNDKLRDPKSCINTMNYIFTHLLVCIACYYSLLVSYNSNFSVANRLNFEVVTSICMHFNQTISKVFSHLWLGNNVLADTEPPPTHRFISLVPKRHLEVEMAVD